MNTAAGRGAGRRALAARRGRRGAARQAPTCGLSLTAPPAFDPAKLFVSYQTPGRGAAVAGEPRRYTLTHSDLTGELYLSIGGAYNTRQVNGWYSQLLRDEVLAEWSDGALHVTLFVGGSSHWWLAPGPLRAFIFRRELPLVLSAFRYADAALLAARPELLDAPIFVRFMWPDGPREECWGSLRSFAAPPRSRAAVAPPRAPAEAAAAGAAAAAAAAARSASREAEPPPAEELGVDGWLLRVSAAPRPTPRAAVAARAVAATSRRAPMD